MPLTSIVPPSRRPRLPIGPLPLLSSLIAILTGPLERQWLPLTPTDERAWDDEIETTPIMVGVPVVLILPSRGTSASALDTVFAARTRAQSLLLPLP